MRLVGSFCNSRRMKSRDSRVVWHHCFSIHSTIWIFTVDIYGGTCDEYELPGNEAWCRAYGNDGEAGLTPNENCCVCSKLVEK